MQLNHCVAKLWDDLDALPETMPRSTKSERRKKLSELMEAITEPASASMSLFTTR
ncbi:hypothetical protein [Sinorhizobium medicae]|nr:hypothetical protein [Sinorhizobium medicae]MDX0531554.1 hypothetical protein [Sinorhizobium medicae]MDX0931263.1 hypothetical protein [Sinorhizobium medicae]MDX1060205.1 hypothetical protein [Sinorhizobium medicae]